MHKFPIFRTKIFQYVVIFVTTIIVLAAIYQLNWQTWRSPLENFVIQQQINFDSWLKAQNLYKSLNLPLFAFIGGLIASISPCKIALLTVNLSYIGTRQIDSRIDALKKAIAFVLGVVLVLSLLGLISSLASAILFQYRGYIHLVVALIMLSMGLSLLELINLPRLPSLNLFRDKINSINLPELLQPFGVGMSFALVGSPCSSPILVSVLSAASLTGNPFQSVLVMVFYALGDTIIIFLASLFTGLATQTRQIGKYSSLIMRLGGGLLIIAGTYYLLTGLRWLFLTLSS